MGKLPSATVFFFFFFIPFYFILFTRVWWETTANIWIPSKQPLDDDEDEEEDEEEEEKEKEEAQAQPPPVPKIPERFANGTKEEWAADFLHSFFLIFLLGHILLRLSLTCSYDMGGGWVLRTKKLGPDIQYQVPSRFDIPSF